MVSLTGASPSIAREFALLDDLLILTNWGKCRCDLGSSSFRPDKFTQVVEGICSPPSRRMLLAIKTLSKLQYSMSGLYLLARGPQPRELHEQ